MNLRIRAKSTPTTYIQFRQRGRKGSRLITVEGLMDEAHRQVKELFEGQAPRRPRAAKPTEATA